MKYRNILVGYFPPVKSNAINPWDSFFSKCVWNTYKLCGIIALLSYRYLATGGGVWMEVAISFFVTVMAGVVCHLVCKWLDRNNKDNK